MRAIIALLALTIFPAAAAEEPSAKQTPEASVTANIQLPNKGKVISTINAGNYTYIEVSEGGKTVWLAALEVAVKEGDMISYSDGPVTTDIYSKSLNRTFEKVIFVSKVDIIK
jgi:hypothetical protein